VTKSGKQVVAGAHRVHIDGRLIVGDGSLRAQKTQYKSQPSQPEKLPLPHPFDLGSLDPRSASRAARLLSSLRREVAFPFRASRAMKRGLDAVYRSSS
jgi:hypothetical protein